MNIRAFIAISFCDRLKSEIAGLQSELRRYSTSGRWKHVDNFHLTLKFLDQVNENKLREIDRAVEGVCSGREPFRLLIGELGCFPGRENIRVLWLGLEGMLNELMRLQEDIENALSPLGFDIEKRQYRPHVTIAQEVSFSKSFRELAGSIDLKGFAGVAVDSTVLYKSEQISGKRVYTPLSEYRFQVSG